MLFSRPSQGLCQVCRNDVLNLLRYGFAEQSSLLRTRPERALQLQAARRSIQQPRYLRGIHSTARRQITDSDSAKNDSDRYNATVQGSERQDTGDGNRETTDETSHAWKNGLGLDAIVKSAREIHGEFLPAGTLTEQELARYVRLYGEPAKPFERKATREERAEDPPESGPSQYRVFRTDDGLLEAVEFDPLDDDPDLEQDPAMSELIDDTDDGLQPAHIDADSIKTRAEEIAKELGGQVFQDEHGNIVNEIDEDRQRLHPLTVEGKFSPESKTIFLPKETFTTPVAQLLSDFSNKHIDEAAFRLFGGPGLPTGLSTPASRNADGQVPIGINVQQHNMSEMEANAFIAALWPGAYASVLSVLVEVRKRLGTDWLRQLMTKEGGPRILDAGSGGAAILAWRDIVRAEWKAMYPDEPIEHAPLGKATVLTGADALRHRSSVLLENTTFVPRLPDYVHVRDFETLDDDRPPPQRKQFDIVLAPHSLWHLKEEFMRKNHVQNLWSLLSGDGGVLVVLEKGVPRGFEVVAAAREMILNRFISSPGSETFEDTTESTTSTERFVKKGKGMIIAPCTNHNTCPMYTIPGVSAGRKDLCTFEQRYIRPQYLQRILKAKHRNHEDLRFSYVAIQKGVDKRKTAGLTQGTTAVNEAFRGYEMTVNEEEVDMLSLPRLIYPPLKRRGHVTMDVCTPEGKMERWTVPKSFSKQAHHDARKSSWGDLWALGAKTRIPRHVRIGRKKLQTKEERRQARREERAAQKEEDRMDSAMYEKVMASTQTLDSVIDNNGLDVAGELEEAEDDEEVNDEVSTLEEDLEDDAEEDEVEEADDEVPELYSDFAAENWKQWNAEYTNPDDSMKLRQTKGGKEAKLRTRAGASKFAPGGLRIRRPTGAEKGGKRVRV